MTSPAQNTAIYISQPNGDGSQTMTVDTGGVLQITNGSLVVGTIAVPALPTTNGVYQLTISGGVATWTAAS